MPDEILTFDQVITESRTFDDGRYLLAGNGFSIDWNRDAFDYRSLYEEANFSGLSVDKEALFARTRTHDFEKVIDYLGTAADLVSLYGTSDGDIEESFRSDARSVRDGLGEVIARRHPDSATVLNGAEVSRARAFLSNFQEVFTVNYDLLLYWITNWHPDDGLDLPRRDGFEWPTESGPYELVWKRRPTRGTPQIFYLHGALHLFEPGDGNLRKMQSDPADPIVPQVRDRIIDGRYPHIVTEGDHRQKRERIKASDYLRHAHEVFGSLQGCLFIHGMALSLNDRHITEPLERRDSLIHTLYVSVFGDPNSAENEDLIESAKTLAKRRAHNHGTKLHVTFYSSETVHIWR